MSKGVEIYATCQIALHMFRNDLCVESIVREFREAISMMIDKLGCLMQVFRY